MGTPTPWLRSGNTQQRPAPQSDYTRAVAEGGSAALHQARMQLRWGTQGAQQNYEDGGVSGVPGVYAYQQPVAQDNELFNQWLAQVTPPGAMPEGGYAYGRSPEGKYAGFNDKGALTAAVRGRAETIRRQDRDMFTALDQMANQGLDGLQGEYDGRRQENTTTERYARTIPTLDDGRTPGVLGNRAPDQRTARLDAADARIGAQAAAAPKTPRPTDAATSSTYAYGMDENYQPIAGPPPNAPLARGEGKLDNLIAGVVGSLPRVGSTSAGLNRSDSAAADRYTGMAEMQAKTDYVNKDLNPWLADESTPLLEQQEFAQSGLSVPIAAYAQRAGAEYGVDPNIVAGWYPESSALTDARDLRDLQFLQETGMTPADFEQALAELEGEQNSASNSATDADMQAYDDAGLQLTGGQALTSELANQVNLPIEDVYNILDSADYQFAQQAINEALSTQDFGYIEETMISVLDGAAAADPALFNILQSVYEPYIPSDYDLYGQR